MALSTPNSTSADAQTPSPGAMRSTLSREARLAFEAVIQHRISEPVIFAICELMGCPYRVAFDGATEGIARVPFGSHPGYRVNRMTGEFTDIATGARRTLCEQLALSQRVPVEAALLAVALIVGIRPSDLA